MQDQSLVGVLVGSIITTLFTWFLDYLKNGREEKGYFRRRKEEVYVQALDLFMAIPIDSNWGQSDLSENVKKRSNYKISFSKLTFPHQLFRVILLEQIYRSFKIINNETYHK